MPGAETLTEPVGPSKIACGAFSRVVGSVRFEPRLRAPGTKAWFCRERLVR
jgi:hypothetical protein